MRGARYLSRAVVLSIAVLLMPWPALARGSTPPPEGESTDAEFTLLYNTIGYESAATKRALVRTEGNVDPKLVRADRSTWRLLNEDGRGVESGIIRWLGRTYGIDLWEVDFSGAYSPGFYKLQVRIDMARRQSVDLVSHPFEIGSKLFTRRTFKAVAIENAEARLASARWGGGYFDCNSRMGEAYSHGIFLAGLVKSLARRRSSLDNDEIVRLERVIEAAADYLIDLHDGETGEFRHEHRSRPNQDANTGDYNTTDALYGLSTYLARFPSVQLQRGAEIVNRCLKAIDYLNARDAFPSWHAPVVYYNLYDFTGESRYAELAIETLNRQLQGFRVRRTSDGPWRGVPLYEGLYYLVTRFPDHSDRDGWIATVREYVSEYYDRVVEESGFEVVPAAGAGWSLLDSVPKGQGEYRFYANTHQATNAEDMIYLAALTGSSSTERIASASVGWIMGTNPGLPGGMVTNPQSDSARVAAAFVMNLDARHAEPWSWWGWGPQSDKMMSLENGFVIQDGEWAYVDEWPSAETFIKHDGAYLSAICVYEDYFAGSL